MYMHDSAFQFSKYAYGSAIARFIVLYAVLDKRVIEGTTRGAVKG